jgi:hypothetical protein
MSRRKVAIAVPLLIPSLALATGTAVTYRMFGWYYAWRFIIETLNWHASTAAY